MNLLETCLLFCGFLSALIVSGVSSQDLSISVEPSKPSLSGSILINCTADVMSKKIESFSVYRGKEEILTFDPTSRPRVQWSDESLKQHFTFYKTLKKQTILSLEIKKPLCTDQNVYKCKLDVKNKAPKEEEARIDFYVQKQGVELTENKATNCLDIDITCVGHAGNPPEHMGWFKKTPRDNEFMRIDASYITTNMEFHTENCSNTRTERLVYKPNQLEQDLIIKCGFGDMAQQVTISMPNQQPQDVTLMYKGQPEVGETLELNCTGKVIMEPGHKIVMYKRTELNPTFTELVAAVVDEKTIELDNCQNLVTKLFSYRPTQEDKGLELMCRITAGNSETNDAMQVIDIQGLFVAPTGITPEHDSDDKDDHGMDNGDEMDKDDEDNNMPDDVTVAPEPEPEGNGEDEADKSDEEPKEEAGGKVEPKKDTSVSENSSGMLREYCLLVFATALLVMV